MAKKRILGTDKLFEETEQLTTIFARGSGTPQQFVPIQRLLPNRFNPRQVYSRESLDELIQSMQTYGFIGALDGRELPDGRVELAYGSRRLLAAKMVNIPAIPVFLHDWSDDQMRFIALVENLAREDLSPIDEANTVGQLHELLGLSAREISERVGKPRSWVQDRLALFRAPDDVKEMVAARPDTLRAARFIARLPDAETRRVLCEKVRNQELTTRQIQLAIQQIEQGATVSEALAKAVALLAPSQPSVPPVRSSAELHDGADRPAVSAESAIDLNAVEAPNVFEQEVPFSAALSPLQQADLSSLSAARVSYGGQWPSKGTPLIILACEALDGFDPYALSSDEIAVALDWLKQLVDKATMLLEILERRYGL